MPVAHSAVPDVVRAHVHVKKAAESGNARIMLLLVFVPGDASIRFTG